eukprot:c3762_g1_i1.p2 GENE.c3762_g1_i1~~c3762_g1_i1.p2  ORF type:complete len:168 (-),score=39.93 c3762_g1_i1:717-1220(-)
MTTIASVVILVLMALIALFILIRIFTKRKRIVHVLDDEEMAFKKKVEEKTRRKRTKRVKKDFEDHRTLLDDYDDMVLDEAVLDALEIDVDSDLKELDTIVSAVTRNVPQNTGTSAPKSEQSALSRVIRPVARGTHTRLKTTDDDDDDDILERQLVGDHPPTTATTDL